MKYFQRLDLVAIFIILCLTIIISILLILDNPNLPQVIGFSWEGKEIGVNDQSFTLNFNRLMVQKTVEENIEIVPSLKGKTSWSGRDLTYTLTDIPQYGKEYTLSLNSAKELNRFNQGKEIQSFISKFKSRDLIYGYIGLKEIETTQQAQTLEEKKKEEKGKLIFYNETLNESTILTTPDLLVVNFAIYPEGDQAVISAFNPNEGFNQQKLFTVTTGLNFQNKDSINTVGKIRLLLDNKDYENIKFKLSKNGQTLIVERKNRQDPNDHSLWVIFKDQDPKPLGILGQDFDISPDGNTLILTLSEGIALQALNVNGQQGFYSGYTQFLAFSADGSQKLMEKFNSHQNYSLILVNKEGKEKELGISFAPFIHCQFQPAKEEIIYCAKTEIMQKDGTYSEKSILARMELSDLEFFPLISLPNDPNFTMSFSSDGAYLIFDQIQPATDNLKIRGINEQGKTIALGKLWVFSLPTNNPEITPEKIKFPQERFIGYHPQWLP